MRHKFMVPPALPSNGLEDQLRKMNIVRRNSRYSWKDIGIIAAVVVIFGGGIASCTYMIADSTGAGLECLVVHCVKVLR